MGHAPSTKLQQGQSCDDGRRRPRHCSVSRTRRRSSDRRRSSSGDPARKSHRIVPNTERFKRIRPSPKAAVRGSWRLARKLDIFLGCARMGWVMICRRWRSCSRHACIGSGIGTFWRRIARQFGCSRSLFRCDCNALVDEGSMFGDYRQGTIYFRINLQMSFTLFYSFALLLDLNRRKDAILHLQASFRSPSYGLALRMKDDPY